MKKRVLSCLLALVLSTATLSGCGSMKTGNEEGGKIKFSVGGWPTEEGRDLDLANERKANFEAKYPQYEIVPDTWKFSVDTFYAKAASKQLPNLYSTNFTEVAQIIENEYSRDLTEAIDHAGLKDKFNKQILDIVVKDGRICSFPYYAYTLGVGYNVELFRQAGLMNDDGTPKVPATWEELREFAVQIKEKTDIPGFIFPTTQNCGGWMFTNIAWSYGVDFMEYVGDGKWKATFDTDECAEALQFIKDLKWKYDVLPATNNINYSEMYTLYGTERGAMLMTAADSLSGVAKTNDLENEKVGIFPMPAGPKRHVALLGGKVYNCSLETTDEQLEGILKYIEFLGNTPELTEESLAAMDKDRAAYAEKGYLVGTYAMSVWESSSDYTQKKNQIIDKYTNVDPKPFKSYNDSLVEDMGIEIQAEEPVYCQDLYKILDNCIQTVLSDENADCRALISEAAEKFQVTFLDRM